MIGEKIMIIDDDDDFLEEIEEILIFNGYKTIVMNNGAHVLDTACMHKPDAILLDLKLKDMSGFQVAQQLNWHPITSHIPIIGITGVFTSENNYLLMDLSNMKMCIEKPINPVDIIYALEKVLKKQYGDKNEIVADHYYN
ncbi:MAG: response regulator [bacterium]